MIICILKVFLAVSWSLISNLPFSNNSRSLFSSIFFTSLTGFVFFKFTRLSNLLLLKQFLSVNSSNLLYYYLGDCFRPCNYFFSKHTLSSPGGILNLLESYKFLRVILHILEIHIIQLNVQMYYLGQ